MQFLQKSSFRWAILFAVFLGAVAFIFILNESFNNDFLSYSQTIPAVFKEKNSFVRVTVDFGDGKRRAFEGKILAPITAFEALQASQAAGGFSLKVTLTGDIADIDGVRPGEKQWKWYLNGFQEERLILDVPVSGGDKVLVKYE
ncbi:MAG: hypothetical protein HYW90_02765 [Candidatus Sungbacteria bacterium]|nr:hypothetical protein [Candidatus Sungbacteria bacterium]